MKRLSIAKMETRHLPLGRGDQKATHIATKSGWVVSALCSQHDPFCWVVGATYLKAGGEQSFLKLVKSLDPGVPVATKVAGLSISPDGVVAVALSNDGIHQFVLCDPIAEYAGPRSMALEAVRHIGNEVIRASGWINNSTHRHSMVVHSSQANGRERISVYGHTTAVASTKRDTLVECPENDIRFFAASPYGHVAFITPALTHSHSNLTLLSTNGEDGVFSKMEIRLTNQSRKACSLAVGNKHVVVGFANTSLQTNSSAPAGWVDVYSLNPGGGLVTSRAIPDAEPTAVSTYSTRVLVGASHPQRYTLAASQGSSISATSSTLYCFSTRSSENFAICRGGEDHLRWEPGTITMTETSWAYSRALKSVDTGDLFTVVEHASAVAI